MINSGCFRLTDVLAEMLCLMQAPAQRHKRALRQAVDAALPEYFLNPPQDSLRLPLARLLGRAMRLGQAGEIHLRASAGAAQTVCFQASDETGALIDNGFSLALAACPAPCQAEAATPDEPPQIDGMRVLLAEDMPINAALMAYLLRKAGAEVDLADNGLQAVASASAQDYDLILMDLRMPEMDGLEAARALRSLPGRDRVMIIGMSADILDSEQQLCLDAGMDGVLRKPLELDALRQALGRASPNQRTGPPALIDWRRLLRLRQELDVETYLDWLRDSERSLADSQAELADLRGAPLARAAHRLAGLAAMLGAGRLWEASRRLELDAARKEADNAARALADTQAAYTGTLEWLRLLQGAA